MDDEFKWLIKEGDGCIFKSCDISCEPYLCTHAVILQCLFCDTLAYTITANGVSEDCGASSCLVVTAQWSQQLPSFPFLLFSSHNINCTMFCCRKRIWSQSAQCLTQQELVSLASSGSCSLYGSYNTCIVPER